MVETSVAEVLEKIYKRPRPISWKDKYIDLIELIEGPLDVYPEESEQLPWRQNSILRAIEDLKSRNEALEIELSEIDKEVAKKSIDGVLDALGHPSLDMLPAELQIEIRFSLDRFGLDTSQIYPDQNRT